MVINKVGKKIRQAKAVWRTKKYNKIEYCYGNKHVLLYLDKQFKEVNGINRTQTQCIRRS